MNKSWIANAVTATNALFGGLSIMMSIEGNFKTAAVFILIAIVAAIIAVAVIFLGVETRGESVENIGDVE